MHVAAARTTSRPTRVWLAGIAVILLSCFRFAHVHLLWADEDYHLAAAIQILHGKVFYRDFWYDKPPLAAIYYLLISGDYGWPLRILDAVYILVACWLCYRIARFWWSEAEGLAAALLLAFFTTFYLPSTVIPFAVDALMIVPHLAAIYFAARGRPVWAGVFAGIAFAVNAKGLFVLLVCALWLWRQSLLVGIGFAVPTACGGALLYFGGAWAGYIEQVWRWGMVYAKNATTVHPLKLGVTRTADWLGFHAALTLGTVFGFTRFAREEKWRLGTWIAVSFAAASIGERFSPHYFLQLLPAMVIAASRGIVLACAQYRKLAIAVLAVALSVPIVRFAPRYFWLAAQDLTGRRPNWIDVNLDLDSQDVARLINAAAQPRDTLFVWGYRPDIYVYTRLIAPRLFWDSQPLTGVPADRHLTITTAVYGGPAAANRQQLAQTRPTWIVDGLGLLNPKLRPEVYPELREWMSHYHLAARTKMSLIYRLR